ncbi:hypothetical protein JCM6882_000161 [Rhodosporidiobolus microsporus]
MVDDALGTLQALFPLHSAAQLQRYLAGSNGNLERAFLAVERGALEERPTKRPRVKDSGGGLDVWLGKSEGRSRQVEELVLSDSSDEDEPVKADVNIVSASKKPFKSAYDVLKPSVASYSTTAPTATPRPTSQHVNLPSLVLTSPEMVRQQTNGLVTLVENVLPAGLASRLYVKMVRESLGEGEEPFRGQPWQPNKWWLVDREVTSPHTSCFYREMAEKLDRSQGYSAAAFDEAAQYWYNGVKRTSRPFTADMDEARELVGEFVRTLLGARERHPMEWQGETGWEPNVAAANCYRGKQESVGWHSDVLQYLGPYATIASLTLGVGRPFRLRPFVPSQATAPSFAHPDSTPTMRTLEIHLPHNSLLVMHGGVQETYKHCIPPAVIDVFKLPKGTLSAQDGFGEDEVMELEGKKWIERINMTFRHYRPDFAPLPSSADTKTPSMSSYAGTPHCACGVPATLRPDGRGRARAALSTTSASSPVNTAAASSSSTARSTEAAVYEAEKPARFGDSMVYFWTCNAGAQNEGKGCGHWRLLDMKKEGRGRWFEGFKRGDGERSDKREGGERSD